MSGKEIEDFSSVALVGTLRAASDSISGSIADSKADAARSVPTDSNKKYLRHLRMGNVFYPFYCMINQQDITMRGLYTLKTQ